MLVRVERVDVIAGETIAYGEGENIETTEKVKFVGDHRPMRDLMFAVAEAWPEVLDLPIVELEPWQIREVTPAA